jgi:tetratricopeptide (TPR) repeat protein
MSTAQAGHRRRATGSAAKLLLATLLVASGPALAATPLTNPSESQFELARQALSHGDLATAVAEMKNALRSDPDNLTARLELIRIYLTLRDGASAEREILDGRRHGLSKEEGLDPLAQAYALQNKYQAVLDSIDANQADPVLASRLLVARGRAYLKLQDPQKAAAAFQAAADRDPTSPLPLVGSAELHLAAGNSDEAEAAIDRALVLAPDDVPALIQKADILRGRGDRSGASVQVDKAVTIDPYNPTARLGRALTALARDDDGQAVADVDKVLAILPGYPVALYLHALIASRAGRTAEAVDTLAPVMAALDGFPQAHFLMASLALKTGDLAQAQTFADQYRNRRPDDPAGRRLAATVSLRRNAPDAAIALLRPLVDQGRDDLQTLQLLASAYMMARDYDAATEWLDRAVQLDPQATETRRLLAATQANRGDDEAAASQLETILSSDPDDTQTLTMLLLTRLRSKDYPGAAAAAGRLAEILPDSPVPPYYLGIVAELENDAATARSYYEASVAKKADYPPALFKLAEQEATAGRHDTAKAMLQKLAETSGTDTRALRLLASYALRENKEAEARTLLGRALERDPVLIPAMLAMAKIETDGRHFDEAESWYRRVLETDGQSLDGAVGLAQILILKGDLDAARSLLDETISHHAEAREPRRLLVETLLRQRREAEAMAAAEELLARFADDPGALLTGGRAEMAAGQPDRAVATFTRLVDLSPDAAAGHLALGQALFAAGNAAAARAPLERAVALSPDTLNAKLLLAEVLYRTGDAAAAQQVALRATLDHPQEASAKVSLGDLYSRDGRWEESAALYETALQQSPDGATLRRYYSALTRTGRADQARSIAEDWLNRRPDDADTRFFFAGDLMRQHDYGAAARHYEALVAAYPERATFWNNLAWLYGELGDDRAIGYAEKAVELQPDSAQIADTLGWLLVGRGETERAVALLAKAWEQTPDNPSIGYHYAEALVRAGRSAEAKETLRGLVGAGQSFDERQVAENLLRQLEQH